MISLSYFSAASTLLSLGVGLGYSSNFIRAKNKTTAGDSVDLVPNCILTRYPLIFIPGKKSFFYFKEYYNTLPGFLAEHGYEVYKANLPWKNTKQRQEVLNKLLSKQNNQIHIFLSTEAWMELSTVIHKHPKVLSINLIDDLKLNLPVKTTSLEKLHKVSWIFHKMITKDKTNPDLLGISKITSALVEKIILKRAIQLAEQDFEKEY